MKGRFAPSPTGRMHLGNIYSAMLAWLSARKQGGGFVLRIEDIDQQRSKEEYAEMIVNDLKWLGFDWDEQHTQSKRFEIYEKELKKLDSQELTYPCYCTRADIMATQAPHESDGRVVYKGTCRPENIKKRLADGKQGATRLIVPDRDISFCDGLFGMQTINLARQCGDFILQRADKAWAYQLAVVTDDALMRITEVVRGRDLLLSVPQQMYLYELLDYKAPAFTHIPLLCNEAGQRLSKRDRSLDMEHLRNSHKAEEIIGFLAYHAKLIDRPEPISLKDLQPIFSWNNIPTEDIIIKEEG